MPGRSPHRRSVNAPGHAHELTFSCYHNHNFLQAERVANWLAEAIEAARSGVGFQLWAYVFMPNHAHLIVFPSDSTTVDAVLRSIKLPVARLALAHLRKHEPSWIERLTARRGARVETHFWQRGGGYDRNVVEPATLARMIDYVHLNPVRKGLTTSAAEWKWSSAGWFVGGEPNALRPDPIPTSWADAMPEG